MQGRRNKNRDDVVLASQNGQLNGSTSIEFSVTPDLCIKRHQEMK